METRAEVSGDFKRGDLLEMKEETGATFIGVHRTGRELQLDTDLTPRQVEDLIQEVILTKPECPIVAFKQSGKEHLTFLNMNHFTICDVNKKGERTLESGLVLPQVKNITQLRRPGE